MSSFTNTFENDVLQLFFNNVNIADLGDATGVRGSTGAGSLYVALFTAVADGESGSVTEATFGAYARQAVARSSGGWTVSGSQVSNTAAITFPQATSGSQTVTHFGIYDSSTGGTLLGYSTLTTSRLVETGVTVEFAIGALTVSLD